MTLCLSSSSSSTKRDDVNDDDRAPNKTVNFTATTMQRRRPPNQAYKPCACAWHTRGGTHRYTQVDDDDYDAVLCVNDVVGWEGGYTIALACELFAYGVFFVCKIMHIHTTIYITRSARVYLAGYSLYICKIRCVYCSNALPHTRSTYRLRFCCAHNFRLSMQTRVNGGGVSIGYRASCALLHRDDSHKSHGELNEFNASTDPNKSHSAQRRYKLPRRRIHDIPTQSHANALECRNINMYIMNLCGACTCVYGMVRGTRLTSFLDETRYSQDTNASARSVRECVEL